MGIEREDPHELFYSSKQCMKSVYPLPQFFLYPPTYQSDSFFMTCFICRNFPVLQFRISEITEITGENSPLWMILKKSCCHFFILAGFVWQKHHQQVEKRDKSKRFEAGNAIFLEISHFEKNLGSRNTKVELSNLKVLLF